MEGVSKTVSAMVLDFLGFEELDLSIQRKQKNGITTFKRPSDLFALLIG